MAGSMKERGLSLKTQKGMSLNIDDRKFIKVQNDYIIEMVNEKMAENIKFVAEIIIASNNKTFQYMEDINKQLEKINCHIDDHERRIKRIEDCLKMKAS
jgi:2-C-methyl-D-erythritol 4-phosphate cytidylyltransferase